MANGFCVLPTMVRNKSMISSLFFFIYLFIYVFGEGWGGLQCVVSFLCLIDAKERQTMKHWWLIFKGMLTWYLLIWFKNLHVKLICESACMNMKTFTAKLNSWESGINLTMFSKNLNEMKFDWIEFSMKIQEGNCYHKYKY